VTEQHSDLWAPRPRTAPPRSRRRKVFELVGGLLAAALAWALFGYLYIGGNTRPDLPSPGVGTLNQIGSSSATSFGDTTVHDACTVISIQHLNSIGVPLAENEPVVQQRLDGSVLPEAALPQAPDAAAGYCSYALANGNALTVSVHQTPFNAAADLEFLQQTAHRAGATSRTEDGLSLAQWHDALTNAQRISVWKPDLLVDISVGTSKPWPGNGVDATTVATRLEPLVKTAITAGPHSHVQHYYDDPFSRLRDVCEVADFQAFDRAFPSQAGVPSIVRGTYHPTRRAGMPLMSCKRSNIVRNGSLNTAEYRELQVELFAADSPQAASAENTRTCTGTTEVVAATPSIGHGRSCLVRTGTEWALWFQLDQVNLRVSTPGLAGTAEEVGDRVVPAALAMVEFGVNH
jgi:hypothetical protein